jgi:hypothetical protein
MRRVFGLVVILAVVMTAACSDSSKPPSKESSAATTGTPIAFGEHLGFEVAPGQPVAPWGGGGEGYERSIVCSDAPEGGCAASITSTTTPASEDAFASMTQCVADASALAGKQVRFSGLLKPSDVSGFAGVWLRVDPASRKTPARAFDNMEEQHVAGTSDWKRYSVTLDVPADDVGGACFGACFGVLLSGSGGLAADDLKFEALA